MSRWRWGVALVGLTALGCNEGDPPVGPGVSGTKAWVTCHAEGSITYDYGCGSQDEDGVCSPSTDLCIPDHTGTFPGTFGFCIDYDEDEAHDALYLGQLANDCSQQCPDEVRDQACSDLGRYAESISCGSMWADYTVTDCEIEASARTLGMTYTPPTGSGVSATGTVSYRLDPAGRVGRTGELRGLSLDVPLNVTVGERDVTALLGYVAGTAISVHSISLAAPVPLSLDPRGLGTLRAGTMTIGAVVSVAEPGGPTRSMPVHATIPWDIVVIATDADLRVEPFVGPFGGTFAMTAPPRLTTGGR